MSGLAVTEIEKQFRQAHSIVCVQWLKAKTHLLHYGYGSACAFFRCDSAQRNFHAAYKGRRSEAHRHVHFCVYAAG